MKKKFKAPDSEIEFELDLNEAVGDCCDECPYEGFCTKFSHPYYVVDSMDIDDEDVFTDFCYDYLEDNKYYPAKGTIEENIPFVLPKYLLERELDMKKIKDDANTFCNSLCILECTDDCPMKKYKNEKIL